MFRVGNTATLSRSRFGNRPFRTRFAEQEREAPARAFSLSLDGLCLKTQA